MKRLLILLLLVALSTTFALAGTVTQTLTVPRPSIEEHNGNHKVILPQAMTTGNVGDPQLPVWGLNLLLPPGEEAVSVTVRTGAPISLGVGFHIPPVQRQYPLSFSGPAQVDAPNPEVYEADAAFPADPAAHFRTHFYRGHGIAAIAVNPVTYNPVTGEVAYYPQLSVIVNTAPTARGSDAVSRRFKQDVRTVGELEGQIDNPAAVSSYGAIDDNTDEPYFDILLITHENMVDMWGDYIEWKTKCGYYIAVETVQDIYNNYTGVDNPEQIRECIIDYYENFDLTYVFLAGDDEIIPHRGLYDDQGFYTDNDIAGDCYFAGLDGNWNDDGDSHWGEPGEADLRAEVFVSRAAVDSQTEIDRFVNKQMMFMREPVVDEIETALMTGEDLGWPIWAWEYKEEIRTGNSSWGFVTAPFPPNFDVRTLYETPGNSWSGLGDLAPLMNQGPQYINHLGHCNVDYMMQLYSNQVTTANFTNNGVNHNFYLIYSQGCYCGSFDNRTTGGSYTDDCISEYFSVLETGAVAVITNSRYGWGDLSTTQGSSQYYDKQFFDAIWGEGLTVVSEANTDSKTDCIPYINYAQNRWCFYELNLFSEPTLDMWTAEPQILAPNYAGEIFLGATSFQVEVSGVEGARVCLSKDGVIYGVGFTDETGICDMIFEDPILSLGPADLYVTAHDYLPHEGSVLVIPPTGAYVIYESVEVDDEAGNNNSAWDYGETVYLDMTVTNVGVEDATDVWVTIITEDTLVTLVSDTVDFGDILQGGTATVDDAFTVSIDCSVEDGHWAPFTLIAFSGADEWTSYFNLQTFAPEIEFAELIIDDATGGNGNGNLDPGESATLNITLFNDGGCFTTLLETELVTADPYITLNTTIFQYGEIPAGEEGTGSFEITVSSACPQEHTVEFELYFADNIGYEGEDYFSTIVGDITYMATGPDNYGYSAYDPNDLPEIPVYEWVELHPDSGGSGIQTPFVNDDEVFHYTLPFPFQYYGITYDSCTIASNGWLGMGIVTEEDYSNSGIPDSDGPAPMIGSYWEDLSPQRTNSGGVWYWYDEANNRYIVEYNHIEQFAPTNNFETFETILYDPAHYPTSTGDGRILMQYKEMSYASQSEGTIGIENHSETDGIQYFFDGDYDVHATPVSDGMCILYSTPIEGPDLTVTLTPENPPIVIPAIGGSFNYNAEIVNNGANQQIFDVWVAATLPTGGDFEIFCRLGMSLAGGGVITRDMSQNVPGNAPAGTYTYSMFSGNYASGMVYAQDSFNFDKSGVDAASGNTGWTLTGWDNPLSAFSETPDVFALYQNYPNPFNPTTIIQYSIPEAAKVKLTVYNTLGQEVIALVDGWQDAGYKSVAMDASGLSSGIYFYRLTAGDFSGMKKMILIK